MAACQWFWPAVTLQFLQISAIYPQVNYKPSFTEQILVRDISEAAPPGTFIEDISKYAFDLDGDPISYGLDGIGKLICNINSTSGYLTLKNVLDREATSQYIFQVYAADDYLGGSNRMTYLKVVLFTTDVNDNAPIFIGRSFASVSEAIPINSEIIVMSAADPDFGSNAEVRYMFRTPSDVFDINSRTGQVILKANLDFESVKSYSYEVIAKDQGSPSLMSSTILSVNVLDASDTAPVFERSLYSVTVPENMPLNSSIAQVKAYDGDTGIRNEISYEILAGGDASKFAVGNRSGHVVVASGMDRELSVFYSFRIKAFEILEPLSSAEVEVIVFLEDVNDNVPTFGLPAYDMYVSESASVGTVVASVHAVDRDVSPVNSVLEFSIVNSTYVFSINARTGALTTNATLDFEVQERYSLLVAATEIQTVEKYFSTAVVVVQLVNVNDNFPKFEHTEYNFSIVENSLARTLVGSVKAIDLDKGDYGVVTYSILEAAAASKFSVNATTGAIAVASPLDFETERALSFTVMAADRASLNINTDRAKVTVFLLDVNDNKPVILNLPGYVALNENVLVPEVFVIKASDADFGENSKLLYSILGQPDPPLFYCNSSTGGISVVRAADYEQVKLITLQLFVRDHGLPPLNASGTLTVKIEDMNDNSPAFSQSVYKAEIIESADVGSEVLNINGSDADAGTNSLLSFSISAGDTGHVFQILPSGTIVTRNVLNRELADFYELLIVVTDGGSPKLADQAKVFIRVLDDNDNWPVFERVHYRVAVNESAAIGTTILTVRAIDNDIGLNADIVYSLAEPEGDFTINATSGELLIKNNLNWEETVLYSLSVLATDKGVPPNSRTTLVTVDVVDSNDNKPIFQFGVYNFSVLENFPAGTNLGFVFASDLDGKLPPNTNGVVVYAISHGNSNGNFAIDPQFGTLRTTKPLDRETISSYNLTVTATDGGFPPLESSAHVLVLVEDVNDNAPLFQGPPFVASVREDIAVGSILINLLATDADAGVNGQVKYAISQGNADGIFKIFNNGSLASSGVLDYEKFKVHNLVVLASDSAQAQMVSSTQVTVVVIDVNDNAPVFESVSSVDVPEAESPGFLLATVKATDKDSGLNGNITYSILSALPQSDAFTIVNTTGEVRTAIVLDRERHAIHTVVVQARDQGQPPQQATTSLVIHVLDVNNNPPVIRNLPSSVNVAEGLGPGLQVFAVQASDADVGVNSKLAFVITAGHDGRFLIDRDTGVIRTSPMPTDREVQSVYVLAINVSDSGTPALWATSLLTIYLTDVNDNAPQFVPNPSIYPQAYILRVKEGMESLGKIILRANATDSDLGSFGQLTFSIAGNQLGPFSINQSTGDVWLSKPIDREDPSLPLDATGFGIAVFTLVASDGGFPPLSSSVKVTVLVEDANDNEPVFALFSYNGSVTEGAGIGTDVLTVSAGDLDLGFNGRVQYAIVGGNVGSAFAITNRYVGTISVSHLLDREAILAYNLTVMARDEGDLVWGRSLHSTVPVFIRIGDINDNDPVFIVSFYKAMLKENSTRGSFVIQVQATDADSGENGRIWYEITSGNLNNTFFVDSTSGYIHLVGPIDRELAKQYQLTVKAEDRGYPSPRKSTTTVIVDIDDVNDNAPVLSSESYNGTILENSPPGSVVFVTPILSAVDADFGDNGLVTYGLDGLDGSLFTIDYRTGVLRTSLTFDRERVAFYDILVYASDRGGLRSSARLHVAVLDVNDNKPMFPQSLYFASVNESTDPVVPVLTLTASDLDYGENSELFYSLKGGSGKFDISRNAGVISLTQPVDREETPFFVINVTVTDGGRPPRDAFALVNISVVDSSDTPPYFEQSSIVVRVLENATVGAIVHNVQGKDKDVGDTLTYRLTTSVAEFQLNSSSGSIVLRSLLDRELVSSYVLKVQVLDSGGLKSTEDALVVSVLVVDVNDNSPKFLSNVCYNDVVDGTPNNTIVLTAFAADADDGSNGDIVYSLSTIESLPLSIDPLRGLISKTGSVNAQTSREFNFTVFATDRGQPPRYSSMTCQVRVVGVNNNNPQFNQTNYVVNLREDVPVGHVVTRVTARTGDQAANSNIKYYLVGVRGKFRVDQSTGDIFTSGILDREDSDTITITLTAQDDRLPPRQAVTTVTLVLLDVNDVWPVFTESIYRFAVREDVKVSTAVGMVSAVDGDLGLSGTVNYAILSSFERLWFVMKNSSTGTIYTAASLDREVQSNISFVVQAYDLGTPSLNSTCHVLIEILDVNDNEPVFTALQYHVRVAEDAFGGTTVATVHAVDADIGENGRVSYSIVLGNFGEVFSISESTGHILIAHQLDAEDRGVFNVTVAAVDNGEVVSHKAFAYVVILIEDANDNRPLFPKPSYSFRVFEDSKIYDVLGLVTASDSDVTVAFNSVFYRISSGNDGLRFSINVTTGEMSLIEELDRELQSTYELDVVAYNRDSHGSSVMETQVQVTISVLDVNDNQPTFPPSCCSVVVSEGTGTGEAILVLSAADADIGSNAAVRYIITAGDDQGQFEVSPTSGLLTLRRSLDRETRDRHQLRVSAFDGGSPTLSSEVTVSVTVSDVNDEVPVFVATSIFPPAEDAVVGTFVAVISAVDRDLGSNRVVSYMIISGNDSGDLALNSTTGVLQTTKALDYERTPRYLLNIEARDHGVPPLSVYKLYEVPVANINDNSPTFLGGAVMSGEVPENAPAGTSVGKVRAYDADYDPLYYYIVGGNERSAFSISELTGWIITTRELDREEQANYTIEVEVTDSEKAESTLRKRRSVGAVQTVQITIADANDNKPAFSQDIYTAGVSENAVYDSSIIQIQAIDADTAELHYSLSAGDEERIFSIELRTGLIRSAQSFAGKSGTVFTLQAVVKDNAGVPPFSTDHAVVKIFVLTDLQRVVITMRADADLVRLHKQDFVNKLENVTGSIIHVDEIQVNVDKTELSFHAVDRTTNGILDRAIILAAVDRSYPKLEEFFRLWNVSSVEGKVTVKEKSDGENKDIVIILVVVSVVLLVFVVFVILLAGCFRKRQKRKLKAATTSALEKDAELRGSFRSLPARDDVPAFVPVGTRSYTGSLHLSDSFSTQRDEELYATVRPSSEKFSSFYSGSLEPELLHLILLNPDKPHAHTPLLSFKQTPSTNSAKSPEPSSGVTLDPVQEEDERDGPVYAMPDKSPHSHKLTSPSSLLDAVLNQKHGTNDVARRNRAFLDDDSSTDLDKPLSDDGYDVQSDLNYDVVTKPARTGDIGFRNDAFVLFTDDEAKNSTLYDVATEYESDSNCSEMPAEGLRPAPSAGSLPDRISRSEKLLMQVLSDDSGAYASDEMLVDSGHVTNL